MGKPEIQLVTRADDAGSSQSANRAIVEASRAGFLRNISIMVPGPTFAEAAEMLAGSAMCLGLHVTLNAEWDAVRWGPVAPRESVRSLVGADGMFYPTPQQSLERGVNLDEMKIEITAQLAMARAHGLAIRYLDQHMGVGWLPGLGDWLRTFAAKEGLLFDEGLSRLPAVGEIADPIEHLVAQLEAIGLGTYLMVTHPAYDNAEMRAQDTVQGPRIGVERDGDRRMLCDGRVIQTCRRRGIVPCRYTDVLSLPAGNENKS